jgi:drug/metabolite transporter (DMT)-like permease
MIVILAYIFYFIAASASPLQRRWLATRKNDANEGQVYLAFQVSLIVALLGSVLPFFQPFFITQNTLAIIGLALIAGIAGAGYFIASYTAQKHVEAGVSTLVSNIYTPITIILATVFLGEKLTTVQIFGTALLLTGVFIVSQKHKIGRISFDKYFLQMLLSGVLLGILLTAERALQKTTGFTAGTLFSWWAQCIFLGLAVVFTRSKCVYSRKDVLITGGLKFLQALSWVTLIFVVGNLSIVSAITTFKVVIIFIAAAIFLDERDDWQRKALGSLLALGGLLLMK